MGSEDGEGLRIIVRVVGLEPTALDLKGRYSTAELHPQTNQVAHYNVLAPPPELPQLKSSIPRTVKTFPPGICIIVGQKRD